ncbi:sensor histidine kinase KdpD [Mucilaginibacter sp. UR6-11]|uniref:sensor histidine kinase n=1 Tax=Mucilaginibacter sp. UR6-11 TaxID=1435644 RepID=UPI001E3595FE|nr:HAMP domain-containing sensor histidine kinase [Mucilaginibacter sp. UR6-11]MCC8425160.1 HAMP domain-containing histidine kinase [Mucilaginibacter sp. UR6-11]
MKGQNTVYRKNSALIIAFLLLVSVTLIIGLVVAYQLTSKSIEGEFSSKKSNVVDQTISSYNDLYKNKIFEINLYSGLLDSASAANYADSVFHNYGFVTRIVFYQIVVGSRGQKYTNNNLGITARSVYEYRPDKARKAIVKKVKTEDEVNANDFRQMGDKLSDYIARYDTLRGPGADQQGAFYNTRPGKISFLNIPANADLKTYHDLQRAGHSASFYRQNMMTFYLDPNKLKIKNVHPELYSSVSIKQLGYDPPDIDRTKVITDEVALPGAFADYKLYFSSPREYLNTEIYHRFMPVAGVILLIYSVFMLIGWLIYRNLSVNLKMFKLQYDFINNFTHEFKTPVSVIKIAGSNLKGDSELTDRQRKHYGKILDEEADKLNDLMNKLLSFTQLENKSITIKKDKIKIEDFVKSYIDTFKIKYPLFKLDYAIDKEAKFLYADTVLLGSVFQNLIENAYKYSHPDKKELFINITLEKRNIIFSFIDKGIGIPKNELNNIFKKFYRLENQYNQNGSVGLGLAFCKELVNFMDGDIVVKSKVDKGSEFIVTLPYAN